MDWRREQAARAAESEAAAVIPAGEPDAESRPRQILIISADIGEGHDLPARAVAREFRDEDPDANIAIVNGLPAMGWFLTKLLRENSAFMFRWMPWLFDFQYRLYMFFWPARMFSMKALTLLGRRGLMRLIRSHNPDVIVSTYPGVTAVLGELRRTRRLKVPCYSSITDLAGMQFWAHPGIDMHFVTHPETIEEVESIAGPGSVRWAKPPTSPSFLANRSRADARRALALPGDDTKVIAVSGGGWGVGDLLGAARAALQVPDAIVLCLCGRNDKLRARVVARAGRRAAPAGDGLHRPDGRRTGGQRRAGPLERRPHRARGDHPRLPGHLLRVRLRARAGLEPGARALRAGPGGAARCPTSGPRWSVRSPIGRSRTLASLAARRPRR